MLAGGKIRPVVLLVMMIGIGSCATRDEIVEPPPPSFGPPLVERLSLRIGYAFDPNLDQEVVTTADARYHLRLEPATRAAFERVFEAVFVDAIPLAEAAPAHESAAGLDGTIRLRLAAADLQRKLDRYHGFAMFELIFLNPDGSQGGVWRVRGDGVAAGSGQGSMELAIRTVAATVATNLDRQPAIRSWLERRD
jgi:hypothetical protein